MGFSFFHVPQHRKFNYKPVYYDPVKEEFEERIKAAQEKADAERNKEYVPGSTIRGSFKKSRDVARTDVKYGKFLRFLSVLSLVIFIFGLMYIAQLFGLIL